MKKQKTPDGPFAGLRELRDKLASEEGAKKKKPDYPMTRPRSGEAGDVPPPKPRAAKRPADVAANAEEDALAFHRLVSGVTPLDTKERGRLARIPSEAAPRERTNPQKAAAQEAEEVHEHLRALVEGGTRFEVSDDGRHVEGRRVDVPADWVRKLRRGLLPIDARIDLHGLSAGEARRALEAFLETARTRGERCVLVVHGKGDHSPGGLGVLRGEISAWLSQGTCSVHVAAFASARQEDGGEGAAYVLLRR